MINQPLFDEGTRNKVHVLGKDPGPVLRTLIHAEHLPQPYGGELEWKFEDEPALDEPTKTTIGEMAKGPAEFVDGQIQKPVVPSTTEEPPALQ